MFRALKLTSRLAAVRTPYAWTSSRSVNSAALMITHTDSMVDVFKIIAKRAGGVMLGGVKLSNKPTTTATLEGTMEAVFQDEANENKFFYHVTVCPTKMAEKYEDREIIFQRINDCIDRFNRGISNGALVLVSIEMNLGMGAKQMHPELREFAHRNPHVYFHFYSGNATKEGIYGDNYVIIAKGENREIAMINKLKDFRFSPVTSLPHIVYQSDPASSSHSSTQGHESSHATAHNTTSTTPRHEPSRPSSPPSPRIPVHPSTVHEAPLHPPHHETSSHTSTHTASHQSDHPTLPHTTSSHSSAQESSHTPHSSPHASPRKSS